MRDDFLSFMGVTGSNDKGRLFSLFFLFLGINLSIMKRGPEEVAHVSNIPRGWSMACMQSAHDVKIENLRVKVMIFLTLVDDGDVSVASLEGSGGGGSSSG